MDCPSEENLIRIKLDGIPEIKNLDFDIPKRRLSVFHEGRLELIESSIADLNLGGKRLSTEQTGEIEFEEPAKQRKLLWTVLAINFGFFAIEMTTGLISGSMGLVADSLDMLADSFVYGISLFAVGAAAARKKNIAKLAGYFQITLAVIGFSEVVRRFFGVEEMPEFRGDDRRLDSGFDCQRVLPFFAAKIQKPRSAYAGEPDFHFQRCRDQSRSNSRRNSGVSARFEQAGFNRRHDCLCRGRSGSD